MTLADRPRVTEQAAVAKPFPIMLKGAVVKGYGRGSRDLGIPTANLPGEVADRECSAYDNGIYFGWASVGAEGEQLPMVMSLGWNPFYKNQKRSAEVHIIHEFPQDFYGEELRVIVLGYIRPEKDYSSADALIADIKIDIEYALNSLKLDAFRSYSKDCFLLPTENNKQ